MQFGVTFYPDQYPREIWDKEFSEIKKIGFGVVRFAEMAWDLLEKTDNKFTFEDLDHAMALCEKHKLKVLLGVPVSQAPQWLVSKYPEILHISNDGYIHPEYGPRPNACRDNPIYKKYAERLTRKMAERYAKHPALFMWQIDNEPNYPPLDLTHNKDYCHCAQTNKKFIKYAKAKYKTLDELNYAWGTKFWTQTFSDFAQIKTPRVGMWDAGNPHIYLDWFKFKSESLSEWLKNLKAIIKEYDKENKIGTNSFTSIINRIADHRVIAEEMDWFGWDIYPKGTENSIESLAQIADYWRSVCESTGSEFIVSELQGGPNVRWGNGDWVTGADIKDWVEVISEHGAKLILFHNWRPPLFGSETGGFGIMKPDGTKTERYDAIKEIIATQRHSDTEPQKHSHTAIYYSRQSDLETYQEEGQSRPTPPTWFSGRGDLGMFYSNNSIAGAYRLTWQNNIHADFIFDKEFEEKIPPYKRLLLANPYLLSEKQFENIMEFVNNGGFLISECRFGLKDEHGHLYEKPLLERLLEVEHRYTEIIKDKLFIPKSNSYACGFRDIVSVKDKKSVEVMQKFEDGHHALLEAKIGKGHVIYATFQLFGSILKFENKDLAVSLHKALII
ncbi:beta-galactosidase [Candidatus Saganbacteria bacterium]|nr:beta-galactosidase [Candidatus Saganbacteria bacterium]